MRTRKIRKVFNLWTRVWARIALIFAGGKTEVFAQESMRILGKKEGTPFYFGYFGNFNSELPKFYFDNVAIIIQGAIEYKGNFTLETIRYYRKIYPNIGIVLSTWQGSIMDEFRNECNKLGVEIVESQEPEYTGIFHLNYQIKSSYEGILHCKNSYKYILKTRADQRFYRYDFLPYLLNIHKMYPVDSYGNLRGRIIYLSTSFLYIPFNLCDFATFGYYEDLINLYSISHESVDSNNFFDNESFNMEVLTKERRLEKYPVGSVAYEIVYEGYNDLKDIMIPEIYITKEFIKKLLHCETIDDKDAFKIYWEYVGKATIIVDERDLLLYWPKYDYRSLKDSNLFMHQCGLDHINWLDIMVNQKWK